MHSLSTPWGSHNCLFPSKVTNTCPATNRGDEPSINWDRRCVQSTPGQMREILRGLVGETANLQAVANLRNVQFGTHAIDFGLTRAFDGPEAHLPVRAPFLQHDLGMRILVLEANDRAFDPEGCGLIREARVVCLS